MSITLTLLATAAATQPVAIQKRLADCHPMAFRVAARVDEAARQPRPDRKPQRRARPCIILASA